MKNFSAPLLTSSLTLTRRRGIYAGIPRRILSVLMVLLLLLAFTAPAWGDEKTKIGDLTEDTLETNLSSTADYIIYVDSSDTTTSFPNGTPKRIKPDKFLSACNQIIKDLLDISQSAEDGIYGYDYSQQKTIKYTLGTGLAFSGTTIINTGGGGGGDGEANTASSVGAGGISIFHQKSGVDLQLKSINTADSNLITVTNDAVNLEVDIGIGSSVVTLTGSQTLTNKSIDADTNTFSNIDNGDIKALAGIDPTKIGGGNLNSTEWTYLGTITGDIATLFAGKQATVPSAVENNLASWDASGQTKDSLLALNDSGTGGSDIWSANKISTELALKMVKLTTSVDNTLIRHDGTSGAVQSTGVTISDTDVIAGLAGITSSGTITFSAMSSAGFVKNAADGTLSGGGSIDISADTNLAVTDPIVLTGDTISIYDASTVQKGAASFSSAHFSTADGAVSIKIGGVDTSELASDSVDDTKLDLGTGSQQINADDIPAGTTYEIGNALKLYGVVMAAACANPSDQQILEYQAGTGWTLINTPSGGGGGSVAVQEDDVTIGDGDAVTIDLGNGLDGSESPDTEINIIVDLGEYTGNALDAQYIADGSVSNAEFQYLDGVTSDIQTQFSTHTHTTSAITSGTFSLDRLPALNSAYFWLGSASNRPVAVQMSGDATMTNAGVVSVDGLYTSNDSSGINNDGEIMIDFNGDGTYIGAPLITYYANSNKMWVMAVSNADLPTTNNYFLRYNASATKLDFVSSSGVGDMTAADWDNDGNDAIDLNRGGTNKALTDPNATRIYLWDDGINETAWLIYNTNDFGISGAAGSRTLDLDSQIPHLDEDEIITATSWTFNDDKELRFGTTPATGFALMYDSANTQLDVEYNNVSVAFIDTDGTIHTEGTIDVAQTASGQYATFEEGSGNGSNFIKLKAADSMAGDETIEISGAYQSAAANSVPVFGASAADVTAQTGFAQLDGDGLAVTAGVLAVDLATNPGLEFSTGELKIKLDGSTLALGAGGISVSEANLTLGNLGGTLSQAKGGTNADSSAWSGIVQASSGTWSASWTITLQNSETITNSTDTQIAFTSNGNEDLILDLDTATDNQVEISSSTGVTELDFSALNLATTGTITGRIPVGSDISTNTTLTDAQVHGAFHVVTAACTVTLPAVSSCGVGSSVVIYVRDASETVIIDANAADRIVLDGTALDDGDSIDSAGDAGDFICLVAHDAAGWRTLGRAGAWTDGGAS